VLSRLSILLLLSGVPAVLSAQRSAVAPSERVAAVELPADSLLALLPVALQATGAAVLAETDEEERADLAETLAEVEDGSAIPFVLAVLASDPSPVVRMDIIDEIDTSVPAVQAALKRHAAADPDADVALAALEALQTEEISALRNLLDQRLDLARQDGDSAEVRRLAREQQHMLTLEAGGALPGFMQDPPPLFSVKPADEPVRVLAFGDFGNGDPEQRQVAEAMLRYHHENPFDFAVTLGDNFYSQGMDGLDDPRWKTWWSDLYDPLGIEFYASLGNHDWGFADSPAAEILYAARSPSWRMPATHYTFSAGPVQFFALDTQTLSAHQLLWLEEELEKSDAPWKLVYAHHPIYSAGDHGDNDAMIEHLLPVLRGSADIYLAGHDHDMQHLKPADDLHFFVAGSGGQLRTIEPGERSIFALSSRGFAVLEATEDEFTVRFMDPDLRELYEYTLRK
jgi:tartrate-resistant acid phosphatase type 5